MDNATRQVIAEAVAEAVEGAYTRLKENGLNDLNDRLSSVEARLGSVEETLSRVESRVEGELPILRENLEFIRSQYE